MNKIKAIQILRDFDRQGRYVFTLQDLSKCFPEDNPKAFVEGLGRLVKSGLLVRAARGVYVNPYALSHDGYVIEHIARALRRGKYNYVSLESMLTEYGAISQIMIDRITIMTTGREAIYHTPYGIIEFTHTNRSVENILAHIHAMPKRPLRVATQETAWRDLKRVGRNIEMVDRSLLND